MSRGQSSQGLTVREHMELFVSREDQLGQTRLIRDGGIHVNLSLNWNIARGTKLSTQEPDEDDLRSYLLAFRPFVSEQEPVYLFRIYNLCHLHLRSDELKGELVKSREEWKEIYKGYGGKLIVNGKEYTPEVITDYWLNGWYFHTDMDKLRTLRQFVPTAHLFARHHFLHYVINASRQVFFTAHIVRAALREGLIG